MKKITSKQADVLQFVKEFITDNGFPPTRQEICGHFGFKSGNAAECHLKRLEAKGAIRITRGASRGIKMLSA